MNVVTKEYLSENTVKENHGKGSMHVCPESGCWSLYYANGFCYCFKCGARFNVEGETSTPEYDELLYDIPTIREHYRKAAYRYSLCADFDYAALRGLDSTVVSKYQLGFCTDHIWPKPPPGGGIYYPANGKPVLFDRITFPYMYKGEVTDIRGRTVTDKEPRYKAPNTKPKARGAIYPFNADVMDTASFLVSTEGEIKTIYSQVFGEVPTVGQPGLSVWREGTRKDIPIIFVVDNHADYRVRMVLRKATLNLARKVKEPYFVVLPLLQEREMQIDNFILHPKGGAKYYRMLIESPMSLDSYMKVYL